jgi:hypothetical protein
MCKKVFTSSRAYRICWIDIANLFDIDKLRSVHLEDAICWFFYKVYMLIAELKICSTWKSSKFKLVEFIMSCIRTTGSYDKPVRLIHLDSQY